MKVLFYAAVMVHLAAVLQLIVEGCRMGSTAVALGHANKYRWRVAFAGFTVLILSLVNIYFGY
jgi:hypothetical protein